LSSTLVVTKKRADEECISPQLTSTSRTSFFISS
jgi:hypothetical protein